MTTRELKQLKHLRREVVQCDREIRKLRESVEDSSDVQVLIKLKAERLKSCNAEKLRLERYIASIPDSYLRQMFDLYYGEGLSWVQLAFKIGGSCTAESARKACHRYLNSNK